jgi:hypothetical protein
LFVLLYFWPLCCLFFFDIQILSNFVLFFFRYGYHLSLNSYFICNDKNIINQLFNDLRNFNGSGKVRYIVTFANIVMLSIDCINKASLMLNCVIISRLKVKHHQWMDNKTCHPRFLVGFVLFDL